MTYDIFISYRRTAFEAANLLATRLKSLGYKVFFDLEEMNQGKFNEQLLERIKQCKDFIIVLPPNALDRCHNQDDWVRMELLCAIANKKNIIPVMLEGFEWPTPMPEGLEDLRLIQAISPVPITYYDSQVKKVISYLLSKPHRKYAKLLTIIISTLVIILLGLLCVEEMIYRPTADKVASSFTPRMYCIDYSVNTLQKTEKEWNKFVEAVLSQKGNEQQLELLAKNMKNLLKDDSIYHERNKTTASYSEIQISAIQSLLLSWRGFEPTEIEVFSQYEEMFYHYIIHSIQQMQEACSLYNNRKSFDIKRFSIESDNSIAIGISEVMSYGYQYDMSLLPKKAQTHYYKMSRKWKVLPMKTYLDITRDESIDLQNQALSRIETAVITHEVKLNEMNNQ